MDSSLGPVVEVAVDVVAVAEEAEAVVAGLERIGIWLHFFTF